MNKSFKIKYNLDNTFLLLSLFYIIIPIIIFTFGWCKLYITILFSLVLIYFLYIIFNELRSTDSEILLINNLKYWLIIILIILIWAFLSGIGGFGFQNDDFFYRNAVYYDLCTEPWPVVYDLNKQSDYIKTILGSNQVVMLCYYFTFWLTPAFITKIFNLSEQISLILLYIYSCLGIFLIIFNINRYFKKCTYIVPILLIFFSGIDIVGLILCKVLFHIEGLFKINPQDIYIFKNHISELYNIIPHIEHYSMHQYSSFTTCLFWIFNQWIPVILILSIFIQLKNNKYIIALLSLTFPFSAWATIGCVPLMITSSFKNKSKIYNIFNISNIILTIFIFLIFGLFYIESGGTNNIFIQFAYEFNIIEIIKFLIVCIAEFGIYYIILRNNIFKYNYSITVLLSLFLFQIIQFRSLDSMMRCSMPSIFLLYIFVLKYLIENVDFDKAVKKVLILILIIGAITPSLEIARSISGIARNEKVFNPCRSYAKMQVGEEYKKYIRLVKSNYLKYNYKNSLFNKYIGK